MGASLSAADSGAKSPEPTPKASSASMAAVPPKEESRTKGIDYLKLPCPVKYEELQREALMTLKPELFEGLRIEFTKPLNQTFFINHGLYMGNQVVPQAASNQPMVLKTSHSSYEFGATVLWPKFLATGRMSSDGRLNSRVKLDINDSISTKLQAQLTPDGDGQAMGDIDLKGSDWQGQIKLGSESFVGANYLQSLTPCWSAGAEVFWLGSQRRSGTGVALRYQGENAFATAQVANTGIVALTYAHKFGEKVAFATDFMYNCNTRDVQASVGYDYMLRQCRVRGRIDNTGAVACYVEEKLVPGGAGPSFVLSGEIDHSKKDYRFGFGLSVGD